MTHEICGYCGLDVPASDGFVLYLSPGGRAAGSDYRVVVHGLCIADKATAGEVTRVSPFAFEVSL